MTPAAYTRPEAQDVSPILHAWRVIRARRWVVLLVLLISVAAAVAFSVTATKEYKATSKLLFRNSGLGTAVFGTDIGGGSLDPDRDAATNVRLATSTDVVNAVHRVLGGSVTRDDLQSSVEVQPDSNSDLVEITATSTDPRLAARIANTFAREYVLVRQKVDRDKIAQGEQLLRQRLDALPATATDERE